MERDNGRNFLMVTNSISWITTEKAYFILSFYGREMNYYDKRATDERAIDREEASKERGFNSCRWEVSRS